MLLFLSVFLLSWDNMNWFKKSLIYVCKGIAGIKSMLLPILCISVLNGYAADRVRIRDQFTPLTENSVHLNGYQK